jgi:hypothetical protein
MDTVRRKPHLQLTARHCLDAIEIKLTGRATAGG